MASTILSFCQISRNVICVLILILHLSVDVAQTVHQGIVTAPHYLASESALKVLKNGGTAIEAMVAAAATISVVYPHMNSIGGDSFWLIVPPNGQPIVIEACGKSGSLADKDFFQGYDRIPLRGIKSALTVAGTIGGWENALQYVRDLGFETLPVKDLLADAVRYAEHGFSITNSQIDEIIFLTETGKISDDVMRYFTPNGTLPKVGEILRQPELAATFKHLSENGLNSFYNGTLAEMIADDLKTLGTPITYNDLQNYRPKHSKPLHLQLEVGDIYNTPPPTQGLVSLTLLGIMDKLKISGKDESEFVHSSIEATKRAFEVRNKFITDPRYMKIDTDVLLSPEYIERLANNITDKASNLDNGRGNGDTVWMGCIDNKGFAVSFIQSLYDGFGSGVVLPKTGISWHNRGAAFTLDPNSILYLEPGKLPYHTLSPAAALLKDGRVMVYGSRGADGQPQYQTTVFHRYVIQGLPLQDSVSLPRWIYGRSVGDVRSDVRIENRFSAEVIENLKKRGHEIVMLEDYSEIVGHAGAAVRHVNGTLEGASDPRSDGAVMGY